MKLRFFWIALLVVMLPPAQMGWVDRLAELGVPKNGGVQRQDNGGSPPDVPESWMIIRISEPARFLPGMDDAVNNGQVREDGDHPEHRLHSIEQGANNNQHDPLGPFEETHLAGGD